MKAITLVVGGSRNYISYPTIVSVLDIIARNLKDVEIKIREGGARGVDKLAGEYAELRGYDHEIVKADWDNLNVYPCVIKRGANGREYNALAGMIRNEQMIADKSVKLVVLFSKDNSSGTNDAKGHAKEYKKDYFFLNANTNKVELGLGGKQYKNISYEEFIEGGYKEWLELVSKSL